MTHRFKTGSGSPPPGLSLPIESSGHPLPPFVHDYLRDGAAEGERNAVIHKVAQQFFWCGLTESEAVSRIMPVAISQGGTSVQREVERAIASAYKSSPREPLEATRSPAAVPASSPALSGWAATMRGLRAAFGDNEKVGLSLAKWDSEADGGKGKWFPSYAVVHTVKGWEKRSKVMEASDGGCFVCINPLKSDQSGASIKNLAEFRHCLVEFDNPDKPLAEQEAAIRAAGFPVSVMLTSGGRSVHAWVRVDAKDEAEWNKRREMAWAAVPGCDQQVKGVVRLSRLPGFMRGDKEQKLLAVNIGAKSWAAWVAKDKPKGSLPDITTLSEFDAAKPVRPPQLVKGFLYQGCKLTLIAPSKARKSWALIDLALSVGAGAPWLGMATTQSRVLYVNFELLDWMLKDRLDFLRQSRRDLASSRDNVDLWNLRGHATSYEELLPLIIDRMKAGVPYGLVIFDPFYKMIGDADENAAGDITKLTNAFEAVCQETGAALVVAHHCAKGDPWDKEPADRGSGSGVFVRDPDAMLVMTPGRVRESDKDKREGIIDPKDKGLLVHLDFIARATAPIPSRWVRWAGYHFEAVDKDGKALPKPAPKGEDVHAKYEPLRAMPPMKRGKRDECDVSSWMAHRCSMNLGEAWNAFENLSREGLGFVVPMSGGLWRGVNYNPTTPSLQDEVDEEPPF